jgi:GH15 family glucan-1,4-alpha-glucosidase
MRGSTPRCCCRACAAHLLTEEYDITQRQMRGNAPQAFVHALLLESVQRLAAPA